MVLNQENRSYSETSSYAAKAQWKWEKKHWLLVISVSCLALWWFGSSVLEVSLIKPLINCLPVIGGLCFAADSIIKLV